MSAEKTFPDASAFAARLHELHNARRQQVVENRDKRPKRKVLSASDRTALLKKTGGRCHICGGRINDKKWQADHVLAHSNGGDHDLENYLPAHSICNTYRWYYASEEFQWILKLGVWLRGQIENKTSAGLAAGEQFVIYEKKRNRRRKSP